MNTIDISILVCGIGEMASSIARRLFAEGYAVAIHQETPPRTLWRSMAFADAWFDGGAQLDGFEARCVGKKTEFLYGLRGRSFIPVLRQPFLDVVEMWSWDVVVATADSGLKPQLLKNQADITIGLGPAFTAGDDCDMVMEIDGSNHGEIIKSGGRAAYGGFRRWLPSAHARGRALRVGYDHRHGGGGRRASRIHRRHAGAGAGRRQAPRPGPARRRRHRRSHHRRDRGSAALPARGEAKPADRP